MYNTLSYEGDWDEDLGLWDCYLDYQEVTDRSTIASVVGDVTNPLYCCRVVESWLQHEGHSFNDVYENGYPDTYDDDDIFPSVEALMTSALPIGGFYDKSSHSFTMKALDAPILNCTIHGLSGNSTYKVTYRDGIDAPRDFFNQAYGDVTTDGDGNVSFAFIGSSQSYHSLIFENNNDNSDIHVIDLNQVAKTLEENMVYNVDRTISD